ncbi:hypothetical protein GCM10009823_30670 [Brevibacterium salitolerans]|uniref:Uncharacterized protein n=2 Tax=Brevibacteriaceae TaxID=85019 RepID=A0ABN2X540_9MICO
MLMRGSAAPKILAVADSESYLKWAAHLLAGLQGAGTADFRTELLLLDTPLLPVPEQRSAALTGTRWEGRSPGVVTRRALRGELERLRPDIVLAAATGPVVQQIHSTAARVSPRPALLSGLPGVGLPATTKGARYRRLGDAFVTHSHAEAAAYRRVYGALRYPADILVTRLPMLASAAPPEPVRGGGRVHRIVFAPQAKVPPLRSQRLQILRALDDWARAEAGRTVAIKLRSREGEQETHHEHVPYRELLGRMHTSGEASARMRLEYGPMAEFLTPGTALVTVSSTAALESLDRGLPTLVVSDFGVNEEMLNAAFSGSGLERTLEQLRAGDFPFPTRDWLRENYFHPPEDSFERALVLLAARSRQAQLTDLGRQALAQDLRGVRAELRTLAPAPVVSAYRSGVTALRRIRSR